MVGSGRSFFAQLMLEKYILVVEGGLPRQMWEKCATLQSEVARGEGKEEGEKRKTKRKRNGGQKEKEELFEGLEERKRERWFVKCSETMKNFHWKNINRNKVNFHAGENVDINLTLARKRPLG